MVCSTPSTAVSVNFRATAHLDSPSGPISPLKEKPSEDHPCCSKCSKRHFERTLSEPSCEQSTTEHGWHSDAGDDQWQGQPHPTPQADARKQQREQDQDVGQRDSASRDQPRQRGTSTSTPTAATVAPAPATQATARRRPTGN
jgi:hypothetical protein